MFRLLKKLFSTPPRRKEHKPVPAFIANDDIEFKNGSYCVSWEGICNSSNVHEQFDMIQEFRERGIL